MRPAQDLQFIDEKPEMFKALRHPRNEFDTHEERFMDGRLRSVAYRESDAQLSRKLAKFEQEAVTQEMNARELDLIDEERAALQRDRNRQIVLEKAALRSEVNIELNFPPQTSRGSFSAVSTPIFASKYALESSRRDLHNALLCTVL